MTIIQKLQARNIIARVAKQQGISTHQCRADIQEVIVEAWRTANPTIRQRQIQLVGEERVPTPEEFILLLTSQLGSAHRVAHTARVWTTPMDR